MGVIESGLARGNDHVRYQHRIVLQYDMMMRLLFDQNWAGAC